VNRPSVDPAFTFGLGLALSVVLWYPTLRGTMSGDIEITDSGIRFLLALVIAWAGVFGVSSLVAMYAGQSRTPPSSPPDSGVHAAMPARRETDPRPDVESPAGTADSEADAA
jgi:hypothetical protein